ncbi:guanosine polyphosphate pyrophosphohydrolase/synthetase [Shewanella sediminis HAW-EB3]|uniref:Guanosine polyphosphate pyrophosphohydrolase/synthetase n=1 Tax=Shewanella sediminis (strain HAW-EB3) TaxID=425104 RepID=A8FU58_SHESH|nr:HD domain-containing protein [Shewanella sediminis]ABV36381.1 guanosine polyphosphate pyrophosphohydrolase/synthetase [Shewanella sediminis HAW-EB3]
MKLLVKSAQHFATQAHTQINHLRKYTKQPYQMHLKRVAQTVSEITDDPEIIAAAWLHDTVEDTPATFEDIELNFGSRVVQFVFDLTDVSRPSDGSRALRKAIDREHLSQASPAAKTIKLADLIDNCADICKHDERFGRVFVVEMQQLLPHLVDGDERLYRRAERLCSKWAEKWSIPPSAGTTWVEPPALHATRDLFSNRKLQRLFGEMFCARDVAESLPSYDWNISERELVHLLSNGDVSVIGLRRSGFVYGYVLLDETNKKPTCLKRRFMDAQLVDIDTPLLNVIAILVHHQFCFVSSMGQVAGVISRNDIQKPAVRMWLFGLITLTEQYMAEQIKLIWPNEEWFKFTSSARLAKSKELKEERERRGQKCDLLDCVQLSDKALILIEDTGYMERFGFSSRREAKTAIKEVESLRNNLAHGQDIVSYDWPQIIRMTSRVNETLSNR